MPTCPPAPSIPPKKCITTSDIKRSDLMATGGVGPGSLLDPQLNVGDARWSKTAMCPPCKGVYTWMSPPKAIVGNRKMSRVTGSQLLR